MKSERKKKKNSEEKLNKRGESDAHVSEKYR